jgi:hypothetical protein
MRPLILAILLLLFSTMPPAEARPGVRVSLTRDTGGDWLVDYEFAHRSPIWFFQRSAGDLGGKPWRPQSWTVETPGVRLERAGHYDLLTAGGAPLRRVRIRMKPFAHPLAGDYTPALAFSDGGLAFYSDHFNVIPLGSAAAVAALPSDLNGVEMLLAQVTLAFRDPGRRLLLRGKTLRERARLEIGAHGGTYLYSGDTRVIETEAFAGVIDGGLPAWVRSELDGFTPRLFRLYTERLGPPEGSKPMALVAWQGAAKPGWSLGGSVLSGMVVMQISGRRVLESSPDILANLRWFLGHESAHFWLGQTIRHSRTAEGWMMEGGSDLLAVRALQQLDPGYDAPGQLQRELDECLRLNGAGKPLATAQERSEHRAHYSCGAMLMLAAEGVAKRGGDDFFAFVRGLIALRRANGTITSGDWLARFEAAGGDAGIAGGIRTFLDRGVADPRAFWERLFRASGVAFRVEGGKLVLS